MDHNNLTEHTEIGCAKLPLVDIPSQDYVGYFDIYDQKSNKVGVVDLAVRLERIALPFGVSASTPATPTFKPTPLPPSVHAPVAISNGSLYPQQQYKQQLQQQHQQHRQQGAGFSSIAAPSSPDMSPQALYLQQVQQQRQQEQQHQAFSSPTVYAPRPVVVASPLPAMYYPSSSNGPAPSKFAASVAPYSSPSMTPQQHQEELDERVPDRLVCASTPGRPFTPIPSDYVLSPSPYHDGPGYSTPTSTAPFSPYRHAQQQQQQQQQHVSSPVPMPLRDEGRSSSYSSCSSSTLTSNENGQIRAEEEENDGSALPPYWEERRMPDGRIFYLDHRNKVTTWTRPLTMGMVPEYIA